MAETAVWAAILVLYLLGCFVMFMFYRDKGPGGNGKWEHLMLVVGWPWVGLISLLMFVLCRSFRSCILDPYGEWEDSDKSDGEDEPSSSVRCAGCQKKLTIAGIVVTQEMLVQACEVVCTECGHATKSRFGPQY
jgi:heme/copper-type cytochrome/quinol oxidase subunit 2